MASYIDLINRFHRAFDLQDFIPNETVMYFRLLDTANRLGWPGWFELSVTKLAALTGIESKNTLYRIRAKLVEKGLIKVVEGDRRRQKARYAFPEVENGKTVFPCIPPFAPEKDGEEETNGNKSESVPELIPEKDPSLEPSLDSGKDLVLTPSLDNVLDSSLDTDLGVKIAPKNGNHNKTENKTKNKIVVVEEAREGLLNAFFSPTKRKSLEGMCMTWKTDLEKLRRAANDVISEWILTGEEHDDMHHVWRHLVSQLRIKIPAERLADRREREREKGGSGRIRRQKQAEELTPSDVNSEWENLEFE